SSAINLIGNKFAVEAIRSIGISTCAAALVVPVATGMSLALCLSSWRKKKPNAKYVLWLRIDQKSCLKSIRAAGYEPIVVCPCSSGDALVSDLANIQQILQNRNEEIIAVMSTTSCFAPRSPDKLTAISALCKEFNVFHLVNNAYGLQSQYCCELLNESSKCGRIDAFVQSLDKNFLVPVGGSIIADFDGRTVNEVASSYPGRASAVPSRDFVLTLLNLGLDGLKLMYETQKELFLFMKRGLEEFANSIGERVLDVPENKISLAMSLITVPTDYQTLFGSFIFQRGITGARVIPSSSEPKTIDGCSFVNFGSHCDSSESGYLNVACAIGCTKVEIEHLFDGLKSAYRELFLKIHPQENEDALWTSGEQLSRMSIM
ncbi:hypothetical protein AB6A40_010942, partial [Gnathostoma spinigerum]